MYHVTISNGLFACPVQEPETDCPCKAASQPLLCSGGSVQYLHHQHVLNWRSCALWDVLCTHALLLSGCVLLDGSRRYPAAQETGHCVQTRHQVVLSHCHGSMLGYVGTGRGTIIVLFLHSCTCSSKLLFMQRFPYSLWCYLLLHAIRTISIHSCKHHR